MKPVGCGEWFSCLCCFSFRYKRLLIRSLRPCRNIRASLLSRWAREEQQRLLEPIAKLNLTDEEKSVLATITVGYRQAMSREVRNRFSATGVAHILAVSGFQWQSSVAFYLFFFLFSPGMDVAGGFATSRCLCYCGDFAR